jgi:hypothetical protein
VPKINHHLSAASSSSSRLESLSIKSDKPSE